MKARSDDDRLITLCSAPKYLKYGIPIDMSFSVSTPFLSIIVRVPVLIGITCLLYTSDAADE